MQVIDKRYFNRCNFDDADEFFQQGDYRSALNIIVNTVASGDGTVESIKGNTSIFDEVSFSLPAGTNKTIGAYADELNNRIIWFNYNSNHNNGIYIYDRSSIRTIVQTTPFSASDQLALGMTDGLNFREDKLINGVELVNNTGESLLFWTDNYNEPRQINIDTDFTGLNTNEYLSAFELIKRPPLYPLIIKSVFDSDPGSDINNLKNVNGQFSYRYVYHDNQNSTWAAVSQFISCSYQSTNTFDTVIIGFPIPFIGLNNKTYLADPSQVDIYKRFIKYIDVAFRASTDNTSESNNPFKLIQRINFADYTPSTYLQDIVFKNDQSYPVIDETDTDRPYDSVPLLSEAMTFAKNRISLANNTEGYDQVPFGVNAVVQEFRRIGKLFPTDTPLVDFNRTTQANFLAFKNNSKYSVGVIYKDDAGRKSSVYTDPKIAVSVPPEYWNAGEAVGFGTIHKGYRQWILQFGITSDPPEWAEAYEIVVSENQTVASFIQGVANDVKYVSGYDVNGDPIFIRRAIGNAQENLVEDCVDGPGFSKYHVKHYTALINDLGNPYTGIIYEGGVDSNGVVIVRAIRTYTPTFSCGLVGNPTDPGFQNDNVPIGITQGGENIYWSGLSTVPPLSGLDNNGNPITDYMPLGLNKAIDIWIDIYNWNNNTTNPNLPESDRVTQPSNNTPYVFATGDAVNIYYRSDGTYLGILAQEIKSIQLGRYLVIPYRKEYVTTTPLGTGAFIETYTPRKNDQTIVYYEKGQTFQFIYNSDGTKTHQTNHVVWQGDVHVMDNVALYAQDFSYNTGTTYFVDFYSMNPNPMKRADFWEKALGRPNIVNINGDKQLIRTTLFRYSNKLIEDSKINGLCTFEEFNSLDVPNDYGPIRRLVGFDTLIVFVNERKPSVCYIEQATFQNAAGDSQVLLTDTYVNNPRRLEGDYGSTHPESVFKYGSEAYWFSDLKGCHVRYNNSNGMFPISQNKARTYFLTKGNQYMNTGLVHGGIDPTFKLAILSFQEETIAYNYLSDSYVGFFSFLPEKYSYINTDMYTFKDGVLWKHNSNSTYLNFYGEQSEATLDIVFNEQPNFQKVFNNIEEESNVVWTAPTITNQNGQETRLIEGDLEFIENVYCADILGDYSNSTDQRSALYYNGPLMMSNVLRMRIRSAATTLSRLRFMTLYSQINQRTNK